MKNRKSGMSLIEIMVGMILIAIIAITALGFSVYCNKFAMQTDLRLDATNFARETMESKYWLTGLALTPLVADNTTGSFAGSRLRTNYNGQRQYAVTNTDPNYNVLSVIVTWTS